MIRFLITFLIALGVIVFVAVTFGIAVIDSILGH